MADPVFPAKRTDSVQAPLYKSYANNWQYTQVAGNVIMAVGNGPARALPVAAGFTHAVQLASGVKDYTPPLMPAPRPDGTFIDLGDGDTIDSTYLCGSITVPLPTLTSQNPPKYRYAVASRFEYLLNGLVGADTGCPGGSYPADFPVITNIRQQYPGARANPEYDLEITTTDMANGNYDWPFTTIAGCFFDPNLSFRGGPAAG